MEVGMGVEVEGEGVVVVVISAKKGWIGMLDISRK
jgi:hypothetical protein